MQPSEHQREERAMRHVDDAEHAENDRQADGDQNLEKAQNQTVDGLRGKHLQHERLPLSVANPPKPNFIVIARSAGRSNPLLRRGCLARPCRCTEESIPGGVNHGLLRPALLAMTRNIGFK
jgi:hypothetical protein